MKRYSFFALAVLIPVLLTAAAGCSGEEAVPTATVTPAVTEVPSPSPTPAVMEEGQAGSGDTVQVHYTGSLDDGSEFDTSIGSDPFQFTLGLGQVIQGFEQAVLGMSIGESKTVVIPAAEAYGPHREELVLVIRKDSLPPDWEPELGNQYPFTQTDGSVVWATVTEITESGVTVDANHQLAGKDLTFEIELVAIIR